MFHLDHLCLGVRNFDEGVRKVYEETGLAHYYGGALSAGIANTIFPLGEDAYLEVEAATGPPGDPTVGWFSRLLADGADRWMFWSLRADTIKEMNEVADRLGGEVARLPREDPATNPDREQTTGGERGAGVVALEIGADGEELRAHIGAETFGRLPLTVVPGRPGVHAITVRTETGREVTLRREPAEL